MSKQKGFFTMATGNEYYYKLAKNMYRSYKAHGGNLPFAIICDRQNKYTDCFDDVIILSDTKNNYLDKFKLFINLPYEENFFIEPDCLIYKNIDFIFNLFEEAPDFYAFNLQKVPLVHDDWFKPDKPITRKYPELTFFYGFNPGYMYFRKGVLIQQLYKDCLDIAEYLIKCPEYKNHPRLFFNGTLRDDPVIWLSAAKNIPSEDIVKIDKAFGNPISLPGTTIIKISHLQEKLDIIDQYNGQEHYNNFLLHFSTRRTFDGLYSHQLLVVKLLKYKICKPLVIILESNFIKKMYLKIHKHIKCIIKKSK